MALEITREVATDMQEEFSGVLDLISRETDEFMNNLLYDVVKKSNFPGYEEMLKRIVVELNGTDSEYGIIKNAFRKTFNIFTEDVQGVTFLTLEKGQVLGEQPIKGTALSILHRGIISSIDECIRGWTICTFDPPTINGEFTSIVGDEEELKSLVSRYIKVLLDCMEDCSRQLDIKTDNKVYVPMVNIIRMAKELIESSNLEKNLNEIIDELFEDYHTNYG